MQYYFFISYPVDNVDNIQLFDDGINFFNWITGTKPENHKQLQPSFLELHGLQERKPEIKKTKEEVDEPQEGGKYKRKYFKYFLKKIQL